MPGKGRHRAFAVGAGDGNDGCVRGGTKQVDVAGQADTLLPRRAQQTAIDIDPRAHHDPIHPVRHKALDAKLKLDSGKHAHSLLGVRRPLTGIHHQQLGLAVQIAQTGEAGNP